MSATDRVGIEIDLMGYEEAMKQMQNLDGMVKGLSGRKGYIKIKAELDKVEMNKRALRANKVKLQADMTDVERDLKRVTNEFKQLQKSMKFRKGDLYNPSDYRNLFKLKKEMSDLGKRKMGIADELKRTNAEIQQSISYAERLRSALKGAGNSGKSLGQIFNGISSRFAHIGSAMQSLGNSISRLMTPLRMLTTGALLGAGYKAMNTISEGLSSGFQRYDTMKKYPRMMKQLGYSSKAAEKSVNRLNEAVIGLPTGLDEIVEMAQRYTLSLGDMKKGEETAIAVNNAFLASMSTEAQRYQGMMQIQDLVNGSKLRTQEWNSLFKSMGTAIREVGKELGYDDVGKFQNALKDGTVTGEQFLETLRKVGTEGGKIAKMANLSKDTWDAFSQNVGNAFSRLMYGVLTSGDKIVETLGLKDADGKKIKSLNSLLSNYITPAIDNLAKSVKGWIDSHPQEILDFFNDLKSIDWKGLGTGFVQGIGSIFKTVQSLAKWASGKDLTNIGRLIFDFNLLGQGLLVIGGIFKGMRGVVATIGTMGVGIGRILGGLGLAGASEKLLGFVNFFKNFGKVGAAAETAAGAAGAGGGLALGAVFKGFIPAIEALAGIGAILTMATGIAALDTKLLSMAVNNMIKITDGMHQVFQNVKGLKSDSFDGSALKNAVEQMFQMWEVFSGTGETVDAHMAKKGGGRNIAQMDKKLLSDMADSMTSMSSILGSMALMKTNMKGLKGFKGFDEKMTEGVTNFATALGGIYSAFDEAFGGEGTFGKGAINPEQAKGFADIISSTETMFGSLNKAMKFIPKLLSSVGIATTTPGGMGESPLASLKKMLIGEDTTGGLFKDLHDLFQKAEDDFDFDVGGFASKMSSAVEAFKSIKKIGNQLAKMGDAGTFDGESAVYSVIGQLKTFVSRLSTALDTTVIGDIAMKAGNLQAGIEGIFATLNEAVSGVEVTVNIKGTVEGHDKLIDEIEKADKAIRDAVKSIKLHYTRTVTVDINTNVNTSGTPSANTGLPKFDGLPGHHGGGYIKPLYRSKGGDIFKPQGSDTVPAMLTPGEWVMRRSAVNAFGKRFMDRINNMDIRGAMRELSARAGHIASINRGVTYNYTTNNNQQVTQHINTSNPNFAYKRSNRYVMAL